MYDLLITGGTLIDGTGRPRRSADVAVQDGRIAAIGDLAHEQAVRTVDATDRFVVPGFVDVNNHADAYWKIFTLPTMDSLIRQGVTTVVGGNSGSSLAPLASADMIKTVQKWTDVSSVNMDWHTMDEFLATVERRRLAVNFGTLVGHGTLRRTVLHDDNRELTAEELDIVVAMLTQALRQGALGLSTALLYAHERSATRDELERLASVVADHGGTYVAYLSDETDGLLDALTETIAIARATGVRLHISHIKAVGRASWPLLPQALAMITAARKDGVDITCDAYPYTVISAVLYTLLPAWVTDGGRTMMLTRLRNPVMREKVVAEMSAGGAVDLADAVLSSSPLVATISRRRIGDIAAAREQSVAGTVVDLLLASEGRASVLVEALSEDNVRAVMSEDFTMIASNGGGYTEEDWASGEIIHPRSFGAFPRFLGRYVRDETLMSWEQAIARVTSLPARTFGIPHRGTVAQNMVADIVVLDPRRIADRATLQQPYRYADGVATVVVGGVVAYDGDGPVTRTGTIIRRQQG